MFRYRPNSSTREERAELERMRAEIIEERAKLENIADSFSVIFDDLGNKYERIVADGKMILRLVESADGTLNY